MGTRSAPTATPGHHGDPPPASQVITTIGQAYGIPEKILSPDVISIKYIPCCVKFSFFADSILNVDGNCNRENIKDDWTLVVVKNMRHFPS